MKEYNLLVSGSDRVEMLTEQTEHGKQLFIEGIFAQAEKKNGNGRVYPKTVMESAIDNYTRDYVNTRRALGELNHPDRPQVDPAEAAIRITELKWDGNDVYGKAIVLNTFKGQQVRGLLEGGFNMGVSTRALGTVTERNGTAYVDPGLLFTAIDAVDDPSAPDAYVSLINESRKWLLTESGNIIPSDSKNREEKIAQIDESIYLELIEDFIKKLKQGQ